MNDALVNIIIPVYNTELFLENCIKSCLSQTYENIHLILINDGSTDKSPFILSKFLNNNKITIVSQKNRGVSAARNKGIMLCDDESYIAFVDSDDAIHPDYIKSFMMHQDESNYYDLIFYHFCVDKSSSKTEAIKSMGLYTASRGPYKKIIKASLAKKIMFNESLYVGEDFLFNFLCINEANKILMIPAEDKYYHGFNEHSLTREKIKSQKRIFDTCLPWKIIYEIVCKESNSDVINIYKNCLAEEFLELYGNYKENKSNYKYLDYLELKRFIKQEKIVSTMMVTTRKIRIKRWLYLYNKPLLKIVKKLF